MRRELTGKTASKEHRSAKRGLTFPAHKPHRGATALFLLAAVAFLSLNLFTLPPAWFFRPGDSWVYLLNAAKMLEGQMIYREFFQFTPPGTELVYLLLLKLFGLRGWIPGLMLLLLGLALGWLTIVIAKKIMGLRQAILSALLFLTIAFRNVLDATHHWYSVLAVMTAAAILFEHRSPARLAAAGALCGLASFFTQARGATVLLGLVVFILWERAYSGQGWNVFLRYTACLLSAFLATVLATHAYFVSKVGLKTLLDCLVVFGVRNYPGYRAANSLNVYGVGMPSPHQPGALAAFLLIHTLVPLTYLVFFIRYRRESSTRPQEPWVQLMLLNIVGVFLFVGIAPAPSFTRLCTVSGPALILLVWLVSSPPILHRTVTWALWIAGATFFLVSPWRLQARPWPRLDLPSGRAALAPGFYEKYLWVRDHTRPSQFFFEAAWADIYFPLGLRNPAPVPYVTNTDYTRAEQVQSLIEALDKQQPRFVLWSASLDVPWPGSPSGDHLGPLRLYLRSRYHVVKTFSNGDQAWQRDEP